MRLRFSLRTFFFLIVVAAIFCYVWFIRPSRVAQQFVSAVAVRDYASADGLFKSAEDKFIAGASDKYWGYQSIAMLSPVDWRQLMRGRRKVQFRFEYFHLDQRTHGEAEIAATPFGMGSPVTSEVKGTVTIEGDRTAFRPKEQQSPPNVQFKQLDSNSPNLPK